LPFDGDVRIQPRARSAQVSGLGLDVRVLFEEISGRVVSGGVDGDGARNEGEQRELHSKSRLEGEVVRLISLVLGIECR
jgi:hypothetical protein